MCQNNPACNVPSNVVLSVEFTLVENGVPGDLESITTVHGVSVHDAVLLLTALTLDMATNPDRFEQNAEFYTDVSRTIADL